MDRAAFEIEEAGAPQQRPIYRLFALHSPLFCVHDLTVAEKQGSRTTALSQAQAPTLTATVQRQEEVHHAGVLQTPRKLNLLMFACSHDTSLLPACQQQANANHQLSNEDRSTEAVLDAIFRSPHQVVLRLVVLWAALGSYQYHRHVLAPRQRIQFSAKFEAIEARQTRVRNHDVGKSQTELLQCFSTVCGGGHAKAVALQTRFQHPHVAGISVY